MNPARMQQELAELLAQHDWSISRLDDALYVTNTQSPSFNDVEFQSWLKVTIDEVV